MRRDDAHLLDVLEAARRIIEYVGGKTFDDFSRDLQCQDAVLRRVSVIGEAARRVSPETRAAHSSLPWREMIAMRNFVIHQYDSIDISLLWETTARDVPRLILLLTPIVPVDVDSGGSR